MKMKKVLAIFLVLTMAVICLPAAVFAETGGSQLITTTVPEETQITPTVTITMPEPGEHPTMAGTPTDENASLYTVTGVSFAAGDTTLSANDTFVQGSYTITISVAVNSNAHAEFSNSNATAVSSTDPTVTYSASRASVSDDAKTATYAFVYTIGTPSWTLRIPANTTVEYGTNQTEIRLDATNVAPAALEITNLQNVPKSMYIEAYFRHVGSFVNKSDTSLTIPFTVTGTHEGVTYAANETIKLHDIAWRNLPSIPSGWDRGYTTQLLNLNVTAEAWAAARPGTYETAFTYSSQAFSMS